MNTTVNTLACKNQVVEQDTRFITVSYTHLRAHET